MLYDLCFLSCCFLFSYWTPCGRRYYRSRTVRYHFCSRTGRPVGVVISVFYTGRPVADTSPRGRPVRLRTLQEYLSKSEFYQNTQKHIFKHVRPYYRFLRLVFKNVVSQVLFNKTLYFTLMTSNVCISVMHMSPRGRPIRLMLTHTIWLCGD